MRFSYVLCGCAPAALNVLQGKIADIAEKDISSVVYLLYLWSRVDIAAHKIPLCRGGMITS